MTASDRWLRFLIGKPDKVEKAKANVLRLEKPRYASAVIAVSVLAGGLFLGAGLAFTIANYLVAICLMVASLAVAAIWAGVISDRLWNRLRSQDD